MPTDRKFLARRYKETPRAIGVGVVRNTIDGKVLIVSGRDLPSLLRRHEAQLRVGAHANRVLQADWLRLGADAFDFEIVDTLPPADDPSTDLSADLRVLTGLWMERLAPFEPAGYHRPAKAD